MPPIPPRKKRLSLLNRDQEKDSIEIIQPDDWHIHLRDGDMLERTVNDAARQFNRVLVMPNLQPPATNVAAAIAYRQRILDALDPALSLDPKMTLYLTDQTSEETCLLYTSPSPRDS